jgi:hypothetical protein
MAAPGRSGLSPMVVAALLLVAVAVGVGVGALFFGNVLR